MLFPNSRSVLGTSLEGLTSEFETGSGVPPPLWSPTVSYLGGKAYMRLFHRYCMARIGEGSIRSRGILVHNGFQTPLGGFHVRAYPSGDNFGDIYGTTEEALKEIARCMDGVRDHLTRPDRSYLYSHAIPWGYTEHGGPVRRIDFYPWHFDRSWNTCNPEVPDIYNFSDGVFDPSLPKVCETGYIIIGAECSARRESVIADSSFPHSALIFLHTVWPDLGYLGPRIPEITELVLPEGTVRTFLPASAPGHATNGA